LAFIYKIIKQLIIISIFLSVLLSQEFQIARIQYGGGGDWYSDPSSLPNLLNYLRKNTAMVNASEEVRIKLSDNNAKKYPYLYMTGHGNIRFKENEIIELRSILNNGGFLHADDNYGMDKSFRREIKKVYPNKEFIELPHTHQIFSSFYEFENGLPKIHEHNNNPPQALAIFENKRIVILYTYESDLGDGWEDATVHNNSEEKRDLALKMGVNIIYFALTQ
tara:strand:- start:926 stop:1588 length:663 start_codon:yes stop_codon:yes gene_type:complete